MLDELLAYHETPEDGAFTARVMRGVRRQQRLRRLILWSFGAVGAAFGVAGATLLAEPLVRVLAGVNSLEAGVAVMAVVALVGWLLHEESGLDS
jgi:membrane associated rhomboid family serine protease